MYKLSIDESGGLLSVTVSGVLDVETDAAIDAEIRSECDARGIALVLIDIRNATTRMSLLDNHESAKTFRQRMGDSVRAVAIIDNPNFGANSEMFEVTSVNRGATVKFFDGKEDALHWLTRISNEPDQP